MANEPTVEWRGASGKSYMYWIYPRHPSIRAGSIGNYIYAKVVNNFWQPVYVGEGDLSVRCSQSHHQLECINSKGATHVHMHMNVSDEARYAEEADILANNANAYDPIGCNIKKGG